MKTDWAASKEQSRLVLRKTWLEKILDGVGEFFKFIFMLGLLLFFVVLWGMVIWRIVLWVFTGSFR